MKQHAMSLFFNFVEINQVVFELGYHVSVAAVLIRINRYVKELKD